MDPATVAALVAAAGSIGSAIMDAIRAGKITKEEGEMLLKQQSTQQGRADSLYKQMGNDEYAKYLTGQAAGTGPSAARLMGQSMADKSSAMQNSLVASAAPQNQAVAARMAAQNAAKAQGSVGGQTAVARQQERMGALNQLGDLMSNTHANRIAAVELQERRRGIDAQGYGEGEFGEDIFDRSVKVKQRGVGERRPPPGRRVA